MDEALKQTTRLVYDLARITNDVAQALTGAVEAVAPRRPTDPGRSEMYAMLDRLVLEAGLVRVLAGEHLDDLTREASDG